MACGCVVVKTGDHITTCFHRRRGVWGGGGQPRTQVIFREVPGTVTVSQLGPARVGGCEGQENYLHREPPQTGEDRVTWRTKIQNSKIGFQIDSTRSMEITNSAIGNNGNLEHREIEKQMWEVLRISGAEA